MSLDVEQRLLAVAQHPVSAPDARDFLDRLHVTLRHRRQVRRRLAATVSTGAILLLTTVGLYLSLTGPEHQDFMVNDEFVLFSDIGDTGPVDVEWVDPSLVLGALNYLIQEADFVENGWKTVETLEELGFIDFQEPPHSEG